MLSLKQKLLKVFVEKTVANLWKPGATLQNNAAMNEDSYQLPGNNNGS